MAFKESSSGKDSHADWKAPGKEEAGLEAAAFAQMADDAMHERQSAPVEDATHAPLEEIWTINDAARDAAKEFKNAQNAEDVFAALDNDSENIQGSFLRAMEFAYKKGEFGIIAKHADAIERKLRSVMEAPVTYGGYNLDTQGKTLEDIAANNFRAHGRGANMEDRARFAEQAKMLLEAKRHGAAKEAARKEAA